METNVAELWGYVSQQMRDQVTLPSLWRALAAAKPLVLENDELVLGFAGEAAPMGGLLMDHRYKNQIEQILERVVRRRVRLRLISGDTLADWEVAKSHDAAAQAQKQQQVKRIQQEAARGETWEAVAEHLVRTFSAMENRAMGSSQGRYLGQALEILCEAYSRLSAAQSFDPDDRNFNRALDRVQERTGVPASLVALLVYERAPKA